VRVFSLHGCIGALKVSGIWQTLSTWQMGSM